MQISLPDGISSLPLFPYLQEIHDLLSSHTVLLVQAEPGAGKSTLLPWYLLEKNESYTKKILLLEPRRAAARAVAERIAYLLGEKPGERVGLRTRHETIVSDETCLEVVTEGILTRMIQKDQSLEDYDLLIFDEFHERNLQADLGLALAWDMKKNLRPELKIIVMSATLSAINLTDFFDNPPVLEVAGRSYPVEVSYNPVPHDADISRATASCAQKVFRSIDEGDVLVFLPGWREIRRAREFLEQDGFSAETAVLHGSLSPSEQQRVLSACNSRRIILSTNVAETGLTIPGIRAVVDSGLERRVRFSPRTGMDHMETARISAASAIQRSGRAGRTCPGLCVRMWNEAVKLDDYAQPEINETDLAPLLLECLAWGSRPSELSWITEPPESKIRSADELLRGLGLTDNTGRITKKGMAACTIGIHPRLGAMLIDAARYNLLPTAALAAAIISEGDSVQGDNTLFDDLVERWTTWKKSGNADAAMLRIEREATRILRHAGHKRKDIDPGMIDPCSAGRLLALAFPDRVARYCDTNRWVLASGRAARIYGLFPRSEFCVITDMDGGEREGRIYRASPLDRHEIEDMFRDSTAESLDILWDGWNPKGKLSRRAGGLLLGEKNADRLDPDVVRNEFILKLVRDGFDSLPWTDHTDLLLARCRFLSRKGLLDCDDLQPDTLAGHVDEWLVPFINAAGGSVVDDNILRAAIEFRIGSERMSQLSRLAPETVVLPSGSRVKVDYFSGDVPVVAARLQEFFGCTRTPGIAGEPVLLHLLSPAGRPVQITQDIAGFWERSYRDVKKELMGRYPKHYWPDDPLSAIPTGRAKPRK